MSSSEAGARGKMHAEWMSVKKGGKMKKILIVDDEPGIRKLVKSTLKSKDYQILQAENGQKAVDIAREENPDLILMDIMMPGDLDGLDVTRILKGDPKTSHSTIIILSARIQEEDLVQGMQAGADEYFTKPFSPLALVKKAEEVLGGTEI
jgi:two-component system, OmpR family, phosphate regulon response regulator PhoB